MPGMMLPVIASDMVNPMATYIPRLMRRIASDYAESHSRKLGHTDRH